MTNNYLYRNISSYKVEQIVFLVNTVIFHKRVHSTYKMNISSVKHFRKKIIAKCILLIMEKHKPIFLVFMLNALFNKETFF